MTSPSSENRAADLPQSVAELAPLAAVGDRRMLEALICPLTHGPLTFDEQRGELISRSARLAFPIREGIPIMLESEARVLE